MRRDSHGEPFVAEFVSIHASVKDATDDSVADDANVSFQSTHL